MADPALNQGLSEVARSLNVPEDALRLSPIGSESMVADAASTFVVRAGPERYVLQISPPAFPDVVRADRNKGEAARASLGEKAGSVILETIAQGRIDGRTYALTPYREPFSHRRLPWRLERRRLTLEVLGWLRGIASRSEEGDERFRAALVSLAELPVASPALRRGAEAGLEAIDRGSFTPRSALMHGDLWKGNLLKDRNGRFYSFVVIDWRGSLASGYPIFDLVRIAESFRLGAAELDAELRSHACSLGCDRTDTKFYLLAALGYIAQTLDQFPMARFLDLAERSVAIHDRAAG